MRETLFGSPEAPLRTANSPQQQPTAVHHHTNMSGLPMHLLLVVLVVLLAIKVITYIYQQARRRSAFTYIPYKESTLGRDVVVTDCTAPGKVPTLTHHKGHHNPRGLAHADSSTGLVLNAIKASPLWGGDVYRVAQMPYITTNHFDIDSFLSVWAYTHRQLALKYESVLRHMARIGDFREAFLSPELVTLYGAEDGVTSIRQAYTALKLCCWLNTLEKKLFSAPYEEPDCEAKLCHFLPRFGAVLQDPEAAWADWQDEYTLVVGGFDQVSHGDCTVQVVSKVGLAIVQCHEPLHYYSLFSHTHGCDVVLSMYDHNRYEVECKYTQFVEVHSRPVWPRVDMAPLAAVLNAMEGPALAARSHTAAAGGSSPNGLSHGDGSDSGGEGEVWAAQRFTDTGPVLRIERTGSRLSRAQRYGHPHDRPVLSSTIPPAVMAALVTSFLEYGLQGVTPRKGGWTWEQLHNFNQRITWHVWSDAVLRQYYRGELSQGAAAGVPGHVTPSHLSPASSVLTPPLQPLPLPDSVSIELRQRAPGAAMEQQGLAAAAAAAAAGGTEMVLPFGTTVQNYRPVMSDGGSALMSSEDVACIVASGALPSRYCTSRWSLLYSTHRDGTSLHSLYRRAAGKNPTVLVVKDAGGHIFGAFAAEPWRVAPRFYGTGETAVFKLHPRPRTLYSWQRPTQGGAHNDFFQFSTHEGLGVGGAGHFAIWLDNDLLEGSSAQCHTFASPALGSTPDFAVQAIELWHLV